MDDETLPPFPCAIVTSFFVAVSHGNVSQRNYNNETPLHVACKPENFSKDVIQVNKNLKIKIDQLTYEYAYFINY